MKDYPFGTGGRGYRLLTPVYIPEIVAAHGGQLRSSHNTYVEVGSEWGFPGLFLWLFFIGSNFWQLHSFRRKNQHSENRYVIESIAIQSALFGFLVASIFGDRLYAEVIYWLCAMSASLWHVSEQQTEQETEKTPQSDNWVTDVIVQWRVKYQIRKARKIEENIGEDS